MHGDLPMSDETRRIIQISSFGIDNNIATQCNLILHALCIDGSVWQFDDGRKEWETLPPIPQKTGAGRHAHYHEDVNNASVPTETTDRPTDIVELLYWTATHGDQMAAIVTMGQAAHEIRRLRGLLMEIMSAPEAAYHGDWFERATEALPPCQEQKTDP